jgi:Type II CAAX prenyl endopeptidase Rce1-like
MRPLHVLVFLLPLIIFYEIGTRAFLTDARSGSVEAIVAHSVIVGFFQQFGAFGRSLPALALISVLLTWHLLRRDRWQIQPSTLLGMLMESVIWAMPLLVLLMLVQQIGSGPLAQALEFARGPTELHDRPWPFRLTISVGAGLYEELLFRFIGMAAMHFVLVDVIRLGENPARILAVVLTAAGFTLYHDLTPHGTFEPVRALVYLCAGLYFGALFLWRGLGIVVAVHAIYDILVLIVLAPPGTPG